MLSSTLDDATPVVYVLFFFGGISHLIIKIPCALYTGISCCRTQGVRTKRRPLPTHRVIALWGYDFVYLI